MDALVGEPLPHGVEQSAGHFLVIDAVEEAEKPPAIIEADNVALVQDGRDPAADLLAAIGDEGLDRVPRVEGMRPVADQLLLVATQRRNPVRVTPVQRPGELKKVLFLPSSRHTLDNEVEHGGRF